MLPVLLLGLVAAMLRAQTASALPIATTSNDFKLPGTQPLTVTDTFSTPDQCTGCHADYGQPQVEPFRNWAGSMMAQSGRDPLFLAAMAIANQDATASGETCLRCHLPKGWLEGRSVPEDGTAMTAEDRQGVQCTVCHRLVDPFANPGAPAEDAAILAALSAPVTTLGNAMMVVDPQERLRGPFDVEADLASDPHAPQRETLVSPFHATSDLCGTCHNLFNPAFTRNLAGDYELNPLNTPSSDVTQGFPEQSTYDEWAASAYAAGGVSAPQFGVNKDVVSTCQDCHMPDVSGKDAEFGLTRDDVPLHAFLGGNTFIPAVLPFHPAFGSEVDADLLAETAAKTTEFLRKAASVSLDLSAGALTVRITNESGHKLPTGYPEGRRMWLHVRAFDAARNVVFESGRYVFETADLLNDSNLHVWETVHGISADVALVAGVPAGPSFHLLLNNVREFDNRIPPRGFTNAAYDVFDGAPVGQAFVDGEHWDDVTYPVGANAVQAEVTLYYQTASKEYVEFLRDENVTTAAGPILFDLWDQHNKSVPVVMARGFLESNDSVIYNCRKSVAKAQQKYFKTYLKEWARCYADEAAGGVCDDVARDAKIAKVEQKLRDKVGGVKDTKCAALNLTPITLGHGPVCPAPCATQNVFDMVELGACAICTSEALADASLDAAYGLAPPSLPPTAPAGDAGACQNSVAQASTKLARDWSKALAGCEDANASGANMPPADCATDPDGDVAAAIAASDAKIATCDDFTGLPGCPAGGSIAATQSCVETAVETVVDAPVEVAYP